MDFTVCWYDRKKYAEVVLIDDDDIRIESGLLDERERREFANHLREIADELSPISEEP